MQRNFSTPTSPKKATDSETETTNSASIFFNSPVNKYREQDLMMPRLRMQSSDDQTNKPMINFPVSSVSSGDSHYSSLFSHDLAGS